MSLSSNFPTIKPSLNLDFANVGRLDPRITFTRATTATYYDGVTTAKAEENLVIYSQPLNTGWVKSGTATVTDNDATAPDGATAAALVSSPATNDYIYQAPTTVIGESYIFSVYVKNSTATISRLWVRLSSTAADILLNWSGATLSSVTQTTGTATFTSVGNDWYRVVVTYTAVETAARLRIYGGDGASTTGNILVWGVQLEQRSSVTAYTATTTQAITNYIPVLLTAQNDVPRFDHTPTTGAALGLEIEEQRTNLLTYSEDFANAAWGVSDSSITSNTIVAPDGTLTGDKLVENTSNAIHLVARSSIVTITANTNYTFSVYAKAAERTKFILRFAKNGSPFTNNNALFDLSAVTATTSSTGFATTNTPTITAVGNGWYRCTMGGVLDASSTDGVFQIRLVDASNNTTYTGDGYSGIFIWGAQVEAGAFATSYIETTTTALTRNADVASMTGTNFSSWFNASEGTFYAEAQTFFASGTKGIFRAVKISDSTERIRTSFSGANVNYLVNTAAGTQANLTLASAAANTFTKAASAYKVNDFAGSCDGAAVVTDTSGSIPTGIDSLQIGQDGSAATTLLNGHIQRIAYYPTRLPDATLQALTA